MHVGGAVVCVVNLFMLDAVMHAPRGVFCDTLDERAALDEHYAICRSCMHGCHAGYGLRHARDVRSYPVSQERR